MSAIALDHRYKVVAFPASDAVIIDTSALSVDEVTNEIMRLIKDKGV